MNAIEQTFGFIIEIEKLKDVYRKTKPVGLDRYENSAEHSWHVCLTALMLKEYANETINIDRVIKMLLLHDLGEIDAGDTIVYSSENKTVKDEEVEGIKRILNLLPNDMAKEYFALWREFEDGETPDAAYAKAIDRIPPLLHNLNGDGHSWKKNNVPKEKVFELNERHIANGSTALWNTLEIKLQQAVKEGLLS